MDSPAPVSPFVSQSNKKRMFLADSSSPADENIDVDMDVERKEVASSGKGKEVISNEDVDDDVDDDACSDLYDEEDDDDDTYYDDMLFEDEPAKESNFDHMDLPPGVEISFPWLEDNDTKKVPLSSITSQQASTDLQLLQTDYTEIADLSTVWGKSDDKKTGKGNSEKKHSLFGFMHDEPFNTGLAETTSAAAPSAKADEPPKKSLVEVLRNFDNFKKFDVVEDYSDHHYANKGPSGSKQKNWAKRIQEEWKILEKDLPNEVFVRVYEARMDLLRAVIIGAEGTPYHSGLYFFDAYFPPSYPSVPPLVHYHSRGLRINPNLYNNGKVCLSLLGTWHGGKNEMWISGVSTMLQVLVSIQGLILNDKPYFNEPGYEHVSGTPGGERKYTEYNERTFMYNLQTMGYNMRRPPKHFEDFVVGYFCNNGRSILLACKAYLGGAKVGSLVKGRVQNVDDAGNKSCSPEFKSSLAVFMTTLINQLRTMGAKDCEEFLYMPELEMERKAAANKLPPVSAPCPQTSSNKKKPKSHFYDF